MLRDALDFALGVVEGNDLLAVGRHIEHHIHHYRLADGAQTSSAEFELYGLVHDILENILLEAELDIVELHKALVLADNRVLRLGKY